MSSKNKDTKSTSDKTKEYRMNKKINKSKIRTGQKSKNALIYPEEDFNINELPSGAFDKNNTFDKNNDDKKENFNKIDSEKLEDQIHKIHFEEDEENEEFDDNYFDPVPYVKK